MSKRVKLALVAGEPAGIGPELCVRALQRSWDADLTVFADVHTLTQAAQALHMSLPVASSTIHYHHLPQPHETVFGKPDVANAPMVVDALRSAAMACLTGQYDGLVTGPTHKAIINDAGIPYSGTTELLAVQAKRDVVMMLANPVLRVALMTTHLPLKDVAAAITYESIHTQMHILHAALVKQFNIAQPRIAVLGLNPHAGEDGHLGTEEITTIIPALDALRAEGMQLTGPLPADTAFLPHILQQHDAVMAMYHDQGLPVLKHSGFEQAVNITLGLPYPRVAVDHGTALALAGKGSADPSSLFAAISQCTQLAAHHRELQ